MVKKILHLTLKKKWFDLIASGEKTIEYRDVKPYWTKRLTEFKESSESYVNNDVWKKFDEIYFKNGYNKNCPFMRVKFESLDIMWWDNKKVYGIYLGKILEIKNYGDNNV